MQWRGLKDFVTFSKCLKVCYTTVAKAENVTKMRKSFTCHKKMQLCLLS